MRRRLGIKTAVENAWTLDFVSYFLTLGEKSLVFKVINLVLSP